MKAVGFNRPLPVSDENCLLDIELPVPEPGSHDLLVEVRAVSVNPADVKVRAAHTPAEGQYRILGWDAAGVVKAVGNAVRGFEAGDEVYYAGASTVRVRMPSCRRWTAVSPPKNRAHWILPRPPRCRSPRSPRGKRCLTALT